MYAIISCTWYWNILYRSGGPVSAASEGEKKRTYQKQMLTESKNRLSGVLMAVVVLGAFGPGGSAAIAAENKMLPLVNYPHAGVSMALPAGFETYIVSDSFTVVRAGMLIGSKPVQAVTLRALCVGLKTTASEFADTSEKDLESRLSVRKFQPSKKSVAIKVAGITGVARVLKYLYDGVPTAAANVFFIRELKGDGLHICYALTVEVAARHEKSLLPTLGKVLKSIKLTTVQSPASIPVRLSERKLSDYRGGFSVRVPEGWYAGSVRGGVLLGQKNYLIGGANSPQIAILSSPAEPDASSQALAKKAVSGYLAAATKPDSGVEVLSHGRTIVSGQNAYQYVLKLTYRVLPATQPSGTATTSKPADKGNTAKVGKIEAVRVVCRGDSSGKSVRAYLFALTCLESEAKFVTPWFDTLCKGFEYLPLPKPVAKPKKPVSASTKPAKSITPKP